MESFEQSRAVVGHPVVGHPLSAESGCPVKGELGGVAEALRESLDKHFRQAKESGAKILEEPQDQFYGDRRYATEDPEGHHWFFAQHVRDVAPEDMKPPA